MSPALTTRRFQTRVISKTSASAAWRSSRPSAASSAADRTPPENHDGNLFALRNCEDLAINGLRVAGKKRSDAWKCVFTDKCDDITINGNEIS